MSRWIQYYGAKRTASMRAILEEWNNAKYDLWEKVFDKKLILKKSIKFDVPIEEIEELMDEQIVSYWSCAGIRPFKDFISSLWREDEELSSHLHNFFNCETLASNIYSGDTFYIPARWTVEEKPFKVQKGCRVMKTLGKIYHVLGLPEECYEEVRQAHSMVLNQRAFYGNLCLSIHPLDYMTMSDNDCGWNSCMRWREDDEEGTVGCYRLGTIEMMNSPCVVVAYLEAAEDMPIDCSYSWNSKKWRMLMIVRPEIILANRNYPYEEKFLKDAALNWMREVCQERGYGNYDDKVYEVGNSNALRIDDKSIMTSFRTDFMYNDINSAKSAYIDKDFFLKCSIAGYRLNYSGIATCIGCGKTIPYSSAVDASTVGCPECMGYVQCCDCEGWFDEDYCHWDGVTGDYYCEDCFGCNSDQCDCCYSWDLSKYMHHYPVLGANAHLTICSWCKDNEEKKILSRFGPKFYDELKDEFVFDINEITDGFFLRNVR